MKLRNKLIPIITCGIVAIPTVTSCSTKSETSTLELKSLTTSTSISTRSTSGSSTWYYRLSGGSNYHYTKLSSFVQNIQYGSAFSEVKITPKLVWDNIEDGSFHVDISWSAKFAEAATSGSINFSLVINYSDSNQSLPYDTTAANLTITITK